VWGVLKNTHDAKKSKSRSRLVIGMIGVLEREERGSLRKDWRGGEKDLKDHER